MAGQKRKLVALLTALFLYLVIGAVIFWKLEERDDPTDDKIDQLFKRYKLENTNLTLDIFKKLLKEEVEDIFKISHFGESAWSFYTALYFCGSVVTTIGKYKSTF